MLNGGLLNLYSKELSIFHRIIDAFICVISFHIVISENPFLINSKLQIDIFIFLISLLALSSGGIYKSFRNKKYLFIFIKILSSWLFFVMSISLLSFIFKFGYFFSRIEIFKWISLFFCYILFSHLLSRHLLRRLRILGRNSRKVLFCGDEISLKKILEETKLNAWQGLKIVAWANFDLLKSDAFYFDKNIEIFTEKKKLKIWIEENNPDIIIFSEKFETDLILKIIGNTTIPLFYMPNIITNNIELKFGRIGNNVVFQVYGRDDNLFGRFLKRAFDLVSSFILIFLLSPLFILVSLFLIFSSKGPIIFKQKRYGIDCKPFTIYKFRTMNVLENEGEIIQATKNDYRVTKFGSFLRKFSIDELPQLFNVFEGTMSLVGPRPHAIQHNEYYRNIIDGYTQRHSFKPGMTGLAQINGFRGETREIAQMKGRIKEDLKYINEWNFFLDIKILFQTIFKITSENAF